MRLYFAPLEGITGYIYREAFEKYYGHIDKYFAPFISPSENSTMVPKDIKDLAPENNRGITLIPQILTCRSELFIHAAEDLKALGYNEVNLNLGCPSGTVCAKGKGAGFLSETDSLRSFLDDIYNYAAGENMAISIKTRLGFYNPDEFYDLVDIFNDFPVSELIVHPRVRGDYYKGEPRLEYYAYAQEHARMPLVYNGNIFSGTDYDAIGSGMSRPLDTVMLGRGVIANPSLVDELLTGNSQIDFDRFWKMHDELYHEYQKVMSPDINVLYRMKELWTYWRSLFDGADREIKRLLKSRKYAEYESILNQIRKSTIST